MTTSVFRLPDLGEGLEDAEIVDWHVAEGDTVELNQPLCTVETAKAEVVLPSPIAGSVTARHGAVGETVLVGAALVELEVDDAHPAAESGGTGDGPDSAVLVGYGVASGSVSRRRRRSRVVGAVPPQQPGPDRGTRWGVEPRPRRPLAKPPVRLLARRLGVDLGAVEPTGPHGTISRADVESAAGGGSVGSASSGPGSAAVAARGPVPGREVPIRAVRRATAERMSVAHREIPTATTSITADFSGLARVRDELGDRIGYFALVCRIAVEALRRSPMLNSTFDGDAGVIHVHEPVHLGFAVATDRGLLVPVVRDAHRLDLSSLAREISRLAQAARAATVQPGELVGSTFSITNFGSFGVDEGDPIINHPEAAILGLGSVRQRPWVVDGSLEARLTAKLTCAFDHRVCDGAEAARFLTEMRDIVEQPDRELLSRPAELTGG